jgi:hypothetical protein
MNPRVSMNNEPPVFEKLVDAGAIDEMELFMRTSLSDSTVTKAFVETQCPVEELGDVQEMTAPRRLETSTEIAITEKLSTITKVSNRIFQKFPRTGS